VSGVTGSDATVGLKTKIGAEPTVN
jgi:hypothetical protein